MSFLNEIRGAIRALDVQKAQTEVALAKLLPGNLVKRVVDGKDHYDLVWEVNGETQTEATGELSDGELEWYADTRRQRERWTEELAHIEHAIKSLSILQLEQDPPDTANATAAKVPAQKTGATRAQRPRIVKSSRPLILVQGDFPRENCIRLAREWGWDLLDLMLTDGEVPKGLTPVGIISGQVSSLPDVKRFIDMGCHSVRYGNRPNPLDGQTPAVLPDLAQIGHMAAMHFIERGFKSVAHAGWDSEDPDTIYHPMYVAFRQCAEAHEVAFFLHTLHGGAASLSRYEARTKGAHDWIRQLPKPVGILTINDAYAASICVMCRHAGILVPEEVALLGVGNKRSICEVTLPTLSSVDSSGERRARRAMHLMRDLIDGKPAPQEPIIVAPAGIVERQSTDLLAVDDPAVAQALRFMWDNLAQNMSVSDVAEAVGVARRSLERSFRGQLGRSVNGELLRKRLEHCCHLLKTTELPIADVAPLCGFSSAGYLNKVFRNAFDTTPRKWRVSSTSTS